MGNSSGVNLGTDLFGMEIVPQIIGITALLVVTAGFVAKSDAGLQKLNVAGCTLWAVHFALLGAWFACAMLCLAVVMIGGTLARRGRVSVAAWSVGLALIPALAFLSLYGLAPWSSLAPVLGGMLINTGIARCRGHAMSAMIAAGGVFWIVTGILVGSPAVIAAHVVGLMALAIRTVRILRHAIPAAT